MVRHYATTLDLEEKKFITNADRNEGYHRESSTPYGPVSATLSAATNGLPQPDSIYGGPPPSRQQQHNPPTTTAVPGDKKQNDANLDGMSALLKAGEIVDGRAQ